MCIGCFGRCRAWLAGQGAVPSFPLFLYAQGCEFFLHAEIALIFNVWTLLACVSMALSSLFMRLDTMQGCCPRGSRHSDGTNWTCFQLWDRAFGDGCLVKDWPSSVCDGFFLLSQDYQAWTPVMKNLQDAIFLLLWWSHCPTRRFKNGDIPSAVT